MVVEGLAGFERRCRVSAPFVRARRGSVTFGPCDARHSYPLSGHRRSVILHGVTGPGKTSESVTIATSISAPATYVQRG
jgi:hypothetical protein